jgi:hypothetical protein
MTWRAKLPGLTSALQNQPCANTAVSLVEVTEEASVSAEEVSPEIAPHVRGLGRAAA